MPKLGPSESSTTGMTSSPFLDPNLLGGMPQYSAFPPEGGSGNGSQLPRATFPVIDRGADGGVGQFPFSATAQPSSLTQVNVAATSNAEGMSYNFEGLNAGTMAVASTSAGGRDSGKVADRGEGAESGHRLELEEEESVSSLPVSIPEELRFVEQFL